MVIEEKETQLLQKYIQNKFSNPDLTLKKGFTSDTKELYLGTEFVGTVYKDSDEGEVGYTLNIPILEFDILNQ
jgi:hypothetical protein